MTGAFLGVIDMVSSLYHSYGVALRLVKLDPQGGLLQ